MLIWVVGDTTSRLGPEAFLVPDDDDEGVNEPNSDSEDEELPTGIVRMSRLDYPDASSACSSSSDDTESRVASPIQEDATSKNIRFFMHTKINKYTNIGYIKKRINIET